MNYKILTSSLNKDHFYKDRSFVVITSNTSWFEPPRMRHQLTRQMLRFYNVVYVQLPFASSETKNKVHYLEKGFVFISLRKLPQIILRFYIYIRIFHVLYNKFLVSKIIGILKNTSIQKAIILNFQFNFAEVFLNYYFIKKVYICNDEFIKPHNNYFTRKILKSYEDKTISNADICFAVSDILFQKIFKINKNVFLFQPGHEFDLNKKLEFKRKNTKFISVCFMGFIGSKICYDWIKYILDDPKINLKFIGTIQNIKQFSLLIKYTNFTHIEPLYGNNLLHEMSKSDVMIIPYDVKLSNVKACFPNKLYQYLSTGRPIVSSSIPSFPKLDVGFIYTASSPESFKKAILKSHEDDNETLFHKRINYAKKSSWDSQGDIFKEKLS